MSSIVDVVFGRPMDDAYEEDSDKGNGIDNSDNLTATSLENQLQHQQNQGLDKKMNNKSKTNRDCLICYEVFDEVDDYQTDDDDDNLVTLHRYLRDYDYEDLVGSTSPFSLQQQEHHHNTDSRTTYKCDYDVDFECNHQICDGCLTQHILLQLQEHRLPIYCPCSIRNTTDDKSQKLQSRNLPCPAQLPFKTIKRLLKAYDNGGGNTEVVGGCGPESDGDSTGYGSTPTDGKNDPRKNTEENVLAHDDQDQKIHDLDCANCTGSPQSTCSMKKHQGQWTKFKRLHVLSTNKDSIISCTRCPALMLHKQFKIARTAKASKFVLTRDMRLGGGNFDDDDGCDGKDLDVAVVDSNLMICADCRHQFCIIHGDAHLGVNCIDYCRSHTGKEMSMQSDRNDKSNDHHKNYSAGIIDESESATRLYIQSSLKDETIKLCSRCAAPIYKDGGCDHIVCANCHDDFCFKCGTHIHLQGSGMIRSCTNCRAEYIDHRYIGQYHCYLCLTLPFLLPFFGIYVCCAAAFVILTFACCFFLCCGARREVTNDSLSTGPETEKLKTTFHPVLAVRTVFQIIFLPFIYIFESFGIQCCCGLSETSDAAGEEHLAQPKRSRDRRGQRERRYHRQHNGELEISSTKDEDEEEDDEET